MSKRGCDSSNNNNNSSNRDGSKIRKTVKQVRERNGKKIKNCYEKKTKLEEKVSARDNEAAQRIDNESKASNQLPAMIFGSRIFCRQMIW